MYNVINIGGDLMRKNGFITSALLYGILALFLVLMLSSLAILANRKMSMDNLKEAALEDVGSTSGVNRTYNIWQTGAYSYTGYDVNAGINGQWQTTDPNPSFTFTTSSYQNIIGVYVRLASNVSKDLTIRVFGSNTSAFTSSESAVGIVANGTNSALLNLPKGNYKYIRVQVGDRVGLSYRINEIGLVTETFD